MIDMNNAMQILALAGYGGRPPEGSQALQGMGGGNGGMPGGPIPIQAGAMGGGRPERGGGRPQTGGGHPTGGGGGGGGGSRIGGVGNYNSFPPNYGPPMNFQQGANGAFQGSMQQGGDQLIQSMLNGVMPAWFRDALGFAAPNQGGSGNGGGGGKPDPDPNPGGGGGGGGGTNKPPVRDPITGVYKGKNIDPITGLPRGAPTATLSGPNPIITSPFRHLFTPGDIAKYNDGQKAPLYDPYGKGDGMSFFDWWRPNAPVRSGNGNGRGD